VTEYIAFAVRADSPLKTGTDLLARLGGEPRAVTVALSTALGNPNHVALAKLTRHAGGDVNAPVIRVFDTALDAVADVIVGGADIAAVTAASVMAELQAGRVRLIGISAPARLTGLFADTPVWNEQGADCVVGAWRGVTGPAGMTSAQVRFWADVLRVAVAQPTWHQALSRLSWSAMYRDGPSLQAYLEAERAEFVTVLGDLGLLTAPRTSL
jgi:putative tricarboxylic transport membrane protein